MRRNYITFTKKILINAWLNELIDILYKYCNDEEYSYLVNKITDYYSHINLQYDLDFDEQNRQTRFFNYLKSEKEIWNFEYFKRCIECAMDSEDFIKCFISYIVSTNMEDIEVYTSITSIESDITAAMCTLGDYPLADVYLFVTSEGIRFDGLDVNSKVRRLGIGTLMLKKIMKDIIKYYPNYDLFATNVLKENELAIEFYESLGGVISSSELTGWNTVTFKSEQMKKLKFN